MLYRFSRPLILVLILVVFSILSDKFWSPHNWNNVSNVIFMQAPFTILMALSMTLMIIFGGIDLGMGSAVAVISCSIGFALNATNNNPLVGIVVGIAVGLVIGALEGIMIAKLKLSAFVATYSMQWILRGVAMLILGGKSIYNFGKFTTLFTGFRGTMIIITAVIVLVVHIMLRYTVFGHNLYAVGINKHAAKISGINVDATLFWTMTISGFILGVTSVMYAAYQQSVEPVIGSAFPMNALAAALVGGASFGGGNGKASNAVVGGLIMLFLTSGMLIVGVPTIWQDAVTGFVILAAIILERGLEKMNKVSE